MDDQTGFADEVEEVAGGVPFYTRYRDPIARRTAAAMEMAGRLTRRERQIVGALALGMNPKEISDVMEISRRTVEAFKLSVSKKVGFSSATRMARLGVCSGLDYEFSATYKIRCAISGE